MSRANIIAATPVIPRLSTKHEARKTQLIDYYQSGLVTCEERIAELLVLFEASTDAEVRVDLQNRINDTINEKDNLKQCILRTNAGGSPIRRLPSELLALIMVCHVHENGQSPWSLLAVSKTWRYLGIETPRLWSLIHILSTPRSTVVDGVPYHHYARCHRVVGILCRHEKSWETILDRSGAVPLDLIIECDTSLMPLEFFSRILQSSHRWRSVVFDIKESMNLWNIGELSLDFPNLQSVTFLQNCTGGQLTDALLSAFEANSTKIRSMTMRSMTLVDPLLSRSSLLQRVKEFDCGLIGGASLLGIPAPVLSNISRLEILTLRDDMSASVWGLRAEIFTRLQVLAVRGFALPQLEFVSSKLKSLTHLYIAHPLMAPPEQHSIRLDNVTHFSMLHSGYNILGSFILPSLLSLELFGNQMPPGAANEELDYIWNSETFGKAPSPLTLHLEVKANDAYLLMALRNMDRLKDLRLYYDAPRTGPSKLLDSLAVRPKKSVLAKGPQALRKWVPPTCPELETLSLVYKSTLKLQDKEDIGEKLQRIQEARLGTAREMKDVQFLSLSKDRHQTTNLGRRNMELGLA